MTRLFLRELKRFGITSVINAGGGFQNYPGDYEVIEELHKQGALTVRLAYNLFTELRTRKPSGFSPGMNGASAPAEEFPPCICSGSLL